MSQNSIWFDLETTGMGYGPNMFDKPVSIWQLAYNHNGNLGNVYANVDVPFEPKALRAYKELGHLNGREKAAPLAYTNAAGKVSEHDMISRFAKLIRDNPDAILSGHNIRGYDIPLMAKKLQQYGLHEELKILKNMRTNDTLVNFRNFMDKIIDPAFKAQLGVTQDNYLKSGQTLHEIGAAFGIDTTKYSAHQGSSDVELAKEIDKILSGPDAAKRYSLLSHIRAHDAIKKKGVKGVAWSTIHTEALKVNPNLVRTVDVMEPPELLRVGSFLGEATIPVVKPTVAESIKPVSVHAVEALDKMAGTIGKGFTEATKASKKLFSGGAGFSALGLFVAADALLLPAFNKLKKSHFGHSDRDKYLHASSLGKSQQEILKSISSEDLTNEDRIGDQPALKIGVQVHQMIQEEFQVKGMSFGSEVPVYDDELGIQGHIDVLGNLQGEKIPIEIKSTTEEKLEAMTEPLSEHASQVNFYTHATGAAGGFVFYVSKDNTKHRKSFYVPYSPERLIRDVADIRSTIISHRNNNADMQEWANRGVNVDAQLDDYYANSTLPNTAVDPGMITSGSKIRDQATRNSHLFPVGTRNYGNNTRNASRYDRRN